MAKLIDGREIASKLRQQTAEQVKNFHQKTNKRPCLAVILIGNDPASEIYVSAKLKATETVGMLSAMHRLSADIQEQHVLSLMRQLNQDPDINGILLQLPLPKSLSEESILTAMAPEKDVDGLHNLNIGRLVSGKGKTFTPCTPSGSLILIKRQLKALDGLEAVVVGRSNLFGKPMAQLLLRENCTVTLAHSHTRNLAQTCEKADILVVGTGQPGMVKGSWIKPGAIVIDVGISRLSTEQGKTQLCGDVDFEEAHKKAGAITPVPGGVGPMTIACLLTNTLTAACRQNNLDDPAFVSFAI